MLTLLRRALWLLLPLALLAYVAWAQWRPDSYILSDLRSSLAFDQGQDRGRGNLLGIQPDLQGADYRSLLHLHRKLSAHLDQARALGLLNPKTVVILPEHIGTWLVAAGEKREAFAARDLAEARIWLGLSHPLELARATLFSQGKAPLSDALLRMKAAQMAADYQSLFGGLAESYGVTLVAGSIVLPEPSVVEGVLQVGSGPLYNVSLVFGSDGLPLGQPQRKVLPHRDEDAFTAVAPSQALQVIATPAGRLGTLLGSDGEQAQHYAHLAAQQVELLAVPAFLPGNAAPAGAAESRLQQALSAHLTETQARAGMLVFLRGQLWDLGSQGRSMAVSPGTQRLAEDGPGARLLNLWL
ncbi:carbon-nitrogen hydrolase family protein [Pseudomonas alcaligenes]|uniref:carbon-nitrogen hydrolase family protein n=1 Tax=Aquipseudomonas alcaligenes TaxID=43263 RepID=UPI00358E0D4D